MVEQYINIPIEVLVFVIFIIIIIAWLFLKGATRLILLWRYKPENDKGKGIRGANGTAKPTTEISTKFSGSERHGIFQTTDIREDRKDSNRLRKLLKRRRN